MKSKRTLGFPLLILVCISQSAAAQSHPAPVDAADRPIRSDAGFSLEYTTAPDPVVPESRSIAKAPAPPLQKIASSRKLADGSPAYSAAWRTASFGSGIGGTGIWSADLDNDGASDLVLGGGSGFGGNAFWSIVRFDSSTGAYEIAWQSESYYPAGITALRIVEEGNTRRIWIGLSDGRIEVVDGMTRERVTTIAAANEAITDFAVADADNDGVADAVALTSTELLLIDPVALTLTQAFPYGGSKVAVGNVDADSSAEVVLNSGSVLQISGSDVTVQWATELFGAHIELGDIDGDGMAELVAAAAWYTIKAFDLDIQSTKWSIAADLDIAAMRLIDVSGDSAPELVYGDGQWGAIYAIDTASTVELWSLTNPEHGVTDIAVIDSDNDGDRELLWGAGWSSSGADYLYVHDLRTRAFEWQNADFSGPYHAVDIGDVDADGEPEIVVASFQSESGYADGLLMVFDAVTHALEWRSAGDVFDRNAWTGVHDLKVANVDADGQLEIIVGTDRLYDGALYVVDGLTHQRQSATIYDSGQPLRIVEMADLTGDGSPEVVTGNGVEHTGATGVYLYVLDPLSGDQVWKSATMASGFSAIVDIEVADVGGTGTDLLAVTSAIHAVRWSDKRQLASATSGYLSVAAADVTASAGMEILAGRNDGSIDVLDGETLAVIGTFEVCTAPLTAMERIAATRIVATCGENLLAYDLATAAVTGATHAGVSGLGDNASLATGIVQGRSVVLAGGSQAVAFVDLSGNSVPILDVASSATMHWRDSIDLQLHATDGDGDALAFELVSLPRLGSAVWLDREQGTLRYSSDRIDKGIDSFAVRVSDGFQYSEPRNVELTLENTPPDADAASLEFHWRGTQSAVLPAIDPDSDPLTFTLIDEPREGTAGIDAASGLITYTPADAYVGPDSLSYAVSDGADTVSGTASIALTNTAPTASARTYEVSPGVTIASRLPAEDADGDPLTWAVTDEPRQGELSYEPETGLFEYVPDPDGSGTDSLTFEAGDGIAASEATVSFRYPAASTGGGEGGGGGGSFGWLLAMLLSLMRAMRSRAVRHGAVAV